MGIRRFALVVTGLTAALGLLNHSISFADDDFFLPWNGFRQTSFLEEGKERPKCPNRPRSGFLEGTVDRVVDGDTAKVKWKGQILSIRFLGIDTPETHYQGKTQGYWGEAAANKLAELLPEKTKVRVELDEEVCDTYGRVLGHLWKDNININRKMVQSALAVSYCIYPNLKHCEEYGKIVNKNVDQRKGFYADPAFDLPYEWRRKVSRRTHSKFIGDLLSHEVYRPGSLDLVEVGDRIFFFRKRDIHPPYHVAQE